MIQQEEATRQAKERFKNREQQREANANQLKELNQGGNFDWTQIETVSRLAQRAKRLGLFEMANALINDPKDEQTGRRVFERILDVNNLINASFLTEGAQKSRAVGRIRIPLGTNARLGTGFMVSPRVMMTNNHVLKSRADASKGVIELDFFERENGDTGPVIRFRFEPELFFITDVNLDFTLVAVEPVNVDGASIEDRGWFPLIGPSGKAVVGERVSIIQHPDGKPQKVALHDNRIVDIDVKDHFIHYKTDTMGGSSGSPVLNIQWDLVALHHATSGNNNEGVRISSIVTRLREIMENSFSGARINRTMLNDLLDSQSPPPSPPQHSGPGTMAYQESAPRFNADGTATWVVPVNITLGVGQLPGGRIAPSAIASAPVQGSGMEDPLFNEAMQALERSDQKEYYNEEEDFEVCTEYYPDFKDLDGTQLYTALSDLLSRTHTTTLSYKRARWNHLYPWIDRRDGESRELRGIYSDKVFDALEIIRQESVAESRREAMIQERIQHESLGPVDEAFLEELEASHPFNCEHSVPQSWFNKRKQPKTDLHHLFTSEWGCNSFRGNRAFFDFNTEAFREDCGASEKSKFEPKHGKGAVARATLYFLLRYPGDIADTSKEMPRDRLATLIRWSNENEVTLWEKHRNAEIQKVQGNRNPLIDFPELADKIDFDPGFA